MNISSNNISVLLAGESWLTYAVEQKGFSSYTTGGYHEGHAPLQEALESMGVDFTYIPNHLAARDFPSRLEDLREFDVVLLSDIPADTLLLHEDTFVSGMKTVNRLELITEFVQSGGGFAMIGGYMSFSGFEGKANYHFSPITDVLPVGMYGYDDRMETPQGVVPIRTSVRHAILEEVDDSWPAFLGYNKLIDDRSGEVLLQCGEDPFLVVREVGDGRTAAFASDCSPHWGSPEFLSWPHYGSFWFSLVSWLAGQPADESGRVPNGGAQDG